MICYVRARAQSFPFFLFGRSRVPAQGSRVCPPLPPTLSGHVAIMMFHANETIDYSNTCNHRYCVIVALCNNHTDDCNTLYFRGLRAATHGSAGPMRSTPTLMKGTPALAAPVQDLDQAARTAKKEPLRMLYCTTF